MIDFNSQLAIIPQVYETAELQDNLEHSGGITISWKSDADDEIPLGSYITYNNVRYILLEPYAPAKKNIYWQYDPTFKHPQNMLDRIPFWITTKDAESHTIHLRTTSFTGQPRTIIQKLVDFLAEYANETDDTFFAETVGLESIGGKWQSTWTFDAPATTGESGNVQSSAVIITVSFDGCSVKSAANAIADAMGCNVYFDWSTKTIRFVVGTTIQGEAYNCFHVLGGTTNMGKNTTSGGFAAVTQRLTLPESSTTGGVTTYYKGSIIDNRPLDSGGHRSGIRLTTDLIFDDIYPKQELFIKSARSRICNLTDEGGEYIVDHWEDEYGNVVTQDTPGAIAIPKKFAKWYVKLATDRELTHEYVFDQGLLINDLPLGILFQLDFEHPDNMSPLVGQQFDLTYFPTSTSEHEKNDDSDQPFDINAGEFYICVAASGDVILPAVSGLVPRVGDKVTLVNMALSQTQINLAKQELLDAAQEIITAMNTPSGDYSETMVLGEEDNVEIGQETPFEADVPAEQRKHGPIVTNIVLNIDTNVAEVTVGSWSRKSRTGGTIDKLETVTVTAGSVTTGGTAYGDGSIGSGGGYTGQSSKESTTVRQTTVKRSIAYNSIMFVRLNTTPNPIPASAGSYLVPVPQNQVAGVVGGHNVYWSHSIPADSEGQIWMTQRIFTSDGQEPQQSEWSTPSHVSDNATFDVEFAFEQSNDAKPANPNDNNSHKDAYPYGYSGQVWFDPDKDQYSASGVARDFTNAYWMAHRESTNGEWGNWVIIRIKGDEGKKGNFKSRVFCRFNPTASKTRPATPSGGTYNAPWPGGETPHTATDGIVWSDGIPSGSAQIWSSVATFADDGTTPTWSTPQPESDTSDLDIEFSASTSQPSAPTGTTPHANHESEGWYDPASPNFPANVIWRAERKVRNGEYDGEWVITRIRGEQGTPAGYTATVYLYKMGTSVSNVSENMPTIKLWYDFAAKKLYKSSTGITEPSSTELGGWSLTLPTGTTPVFVTAAVAYSVNARDDIEKTEWVTPVQFTGDDGNPGTDGINTATIFIYKRAASIQSTDKPGTLYYKFSDGKLYKRSGSAGSYTYTEVTDGSTNMAGWYRNIPATDGNPCWVRQVVALGTDVYDDVSEWSTAVKLIEDGESITKTSETLYYAITDASSDHPAADSTAWKTTKAAAIEAAGGTWAQDTILWTKTDILWSDGTHTFLFSGDRNPNDGIPGMDVVAGTTTITYALTQTNQQPNDSQFGDYPSTLTQGWYLWSKSVTPFYKGSTSGASAGQSVVYNVSYISVDGDSGRGVIEVKEFYKASANSSGETAPNNDSGWYDNPNTAMQSWNETNKYLWNYERVKYNKGTEYERTTPAVISIWTKDGDTGRGIDSIVNKYKITNSVTAPAREHEGGTGWSTTPVAPTASSQYLWNYEVITWTSGTTTTYTDVQMIGHYGKDGSTPTIGENGHWYINGQDTGVVAEGHDGTGIALKGTVATVNDLPTSPTPEIGDCYMVTANGHLYMYDGISNDGKQGYKDVGRLKGEPGNDGTTYYYHIAYATTITFTNNTVTGQTGFTTVKGSTDYAWMGLCVDENINDPGYDAITESQKLNAAKQYEWNYVKGADGASPWLADLDNEMDSVACDNDKHPIAAQSVTTKLSLYHGITSETFTVSVKRNGTAVTLGTASGGVTVSFNSTTKVMTVAYTTSATINGKDEFEITLTSSTDNTVTRVLTLTVNGIKGDAKYSLVPSASVISKNPNTNTYSPNTLTCSYSKFDVAKGQEVTASGATIKYTKDGGATEYPFTIGTTELTAGGTGNTGFTSEVVFLLYVGTSLVDKERIPVIKEGLNGSSGQNAIRVDLDNEMDSMLYDGAGNKLSGNIVSHAYLFDGISDKTSSATWALSSSGCTILSSTGSTITVTSVSSIDATVTATATYGDKTYTAVMSIKKIVNADKYDLDVTPNALFLNTSDGWSASKTITIKVMRTPAGGGTPTAVNPSDYGLVVSASVGTLGSYSSTTKGYTLTVSRAQASSNDNTVISVYKTGDSDTVYDRETIPFNKAYNGTKGDTPIQLFKWLGSSETVSAPTVTAANYIAGTNLGGWSKTAPNRVADKDLYLSQNTLKGDNTLAGSWSTPVRISGEDGDPGADAKEREWIYIGESTQTTFSGTSHPKNINKDVNGTPRDHDTYIIVTDDFVPYGWSDNAIATDDTNNKYVYASWRDWNKTTNKWGDFNDPILWSNWGTRGIDGDGVQYLFRRFTSLRDASQLTSLQTELNNGKTFNNTTKEWECANWTDDPVGPDSTNKFEYCAIIKRINGTWGNFEVPSLWSKWSDDGNPGHTVWKANAYRRFEEEPASWTSSNMPTATTATPSTTSFGNDWMSTPPSEGQSSTVVTGGVTNIGLDSSLQQWENADDNSHSGWRKAKGYGNGDSADTVTIGSGTSTSSFTPTYTLYKYSLSQILYKQTEIGAAGSITSIAFNSTAAKIRSLDVYLIHTTKDSFSSGSDWETATPTLCYSGSVSFVENGWTVINLTTPFSYNGTNNLVVMVYDKTGVGNSGLKCYYTSNTGRAIYKTSGEALDITSISSISGNRGSYVSNIQIGITRSGGSVVHNDNVFKVDRINFTTLSASETFQIEIASSTQATYDGVYVGTPDTAASQSTSITSIDSTKKVTGVSSKTVSLSITSEGTHYVDVVFYKNGSNWANDDCGWYRVITTEHTDTETVTSGGDLYESIATFDDGSIVSPPGWSTPVKVSANGMNAIRMDLDNMMDSIPCDSDGVVTETTVLTTYARIYDGASVVTSGVSVQSAGAIANVTAVTSVPQSGVATISWTIAAGRTLTSDKYTAQIELIYKNVSYYDTFTANVVKSGAPGEAPEIVQVLPSVSALKFSKSEQTSATTKTISCGYVKTTANGIESSLDASSVVVNNETYYVAYKFSNSNSWNWYGTGGVSISGDTTANGIDFALSNASNSSSIDDDNIIDIETVPFLFDGVDGAPGGNDDFSLLSKLVTVWVDDGLLALESDDSISCQVSIGQATNSGISYSPSNNRLLKDGVNVSNTYPECLTIARTVYEALGIFTFRVEDDFTTTTTDNTVVLKMASFTDPFTNSVIKGSVGIWIRYNSVWMCIRENTTAVMENYGDSLVQAVFSDREHSTGYASRMLTLDNMIELLSVVDDERGQTLAEALFRIGSNVRYYDGSSHTDANELVYDSDNHYWKYKVSGSRYYDSNIQNVADSYAKLSADEIDFNGKYIDFQSNNSYVPGYIRIGFERKSEDLGGGIIIYEDRMAITLNDGKKDFLSFGSVSVEQNPYGYYFNFEEGEISCGRINCNQTFSRINSLGPVIVYDTELDEYGNPISYITPGFTGFGNMDGTTTFDTADGKRVTVRGGIITDISPIT